MRALFIALLAIVCILPTYHECVVFSLITIGVRIMLELTHWEQTALNPMDLLDRVVGLDDEFLSIYTHVMAFSELLLGPGYFTEVKAAFLANASDIGGIEVNDVEGLRQELWAGYHPIVLLYGRLSVYGAEGKFHYTDSSDPSDSIALKDEITVARQFHDWIPESAVSLSETGGKGLFGTVLQLADARYTIDTQQPLTVDQVTVLSGVSKRTIQNALSKRDESGLSVGEDGLISNQEARDWLESRRSFVFTTPYREESTDESSNTEVSESGEYLFVPVADDGSAFLPSARRAQGYQIGAKGSEEYIDDYFVALSKLQGMKRPRWRRPNENGNWGIKAGVTWKRLPKDEVDRHFGDVE
jgi:hypothetical protein